MIPSSSALVSLKPARQAALQAIMTVEEARQRLSPATGNTVRCR